MIRQYTVELGCQGGGTEHFEVRAYSAADAVFQVTLDRKNYTWVAVRPAEESRQGALGENTEFRATLPAK